ncbi:MAG: HAMP domain-containing sensor histidine kinase [Candidatus Omnitrophota bacterium]
MQKGRDDIGRSDYLLERVFWLIRLRWVAAVGVLSVAFLLPRIFQNRLFLNTAPMYGTAAFLALYNAVLFLVLSFQKKKKLSFSERWINLFANVQISIDLTCLGYLVHFSGGIENPFIFYFIFHMIFASILLTRRASFFQATYATFLFFLLVLSESSGILPHYCLRSVYSYPLHENIFYNIGVSFVFISTLYITVFLATSISAQLRERERSLAAVNRLLREKDKIKSEYVLRVTHDIRQDLAAIQSCIEPVTMGITGPLASAQEDLLHRAIARSMQLIVYVDALLDITKLKLTEQLKMESVSLHELAQNISVQVGELARNRQLSFEFKIDNEPVMIRGVRVYLEEALLNLLKNSLKYTLAGGKIVFEVAASGDWVSIRIEDTGIGIPAEDLPHVFEEFYRANNAKSREKKGTGLGLSITKHVVEMHQGTIEVESALGKGTIFRLALPIFRGQKSA